MTNDAASRWRGAASYTAGSARQWAPYVGFAALVFLASAAAGATSGVAESSAFVPDVGGGSVDATGAFLYLLSVAAVMIVGGVFVAMPTIALLGLQGYQFGAAVAVLVDALGAADALALAAPAAALALPALWLVGAIPLRGLHYAARMVREPPPPAVPSERLVGESVAIAATALAGLYLATLFAAAAPT